MNATLRPTWRALIRGGLTFSEATWDFLFPTSCPWCGNPVYRCREKNHPAFCKACHDRIVPAVSAVCRRCGAPVGPHLDSKNGCIHCRNDRFAFDAVFSLGAYRSDLAAACQFGKHPAGRAVIAALTNEFCQRFQTSIRAARCNAVIASPQHRSRRWWNPYNPADLIARRIGNILNVPLLSHILQKVRRAARQSTLSPTERRRNLRGAFRVHHPSAIQGRRLLFVDDILTTGTTAHRAAKELLKAEAESVTVAVLARGLGQ